QPRLVPEQQLALVGALRAEDVDDDGERLDPELLFDIGREPIHALAEVDRLRRHENPDAGRRDDHASTFSAFNPIASALPSTGPRTRTVAGPIEISIVEASQRAGAGVVTRAGVGSS